MSPGGTGGRALRRKIDALLRSGELSEHLDEIRQMPKRRAISALLALLCTTDPEVKQRAVTAMGFLVADLADSDREAAREVVRRLMWILNEESGSSGWGAPEALAEILARHGELAREYTAILVSYMRSDGNFLEHPPLQRELLQGIGRLAGVRPRFLLEQDADRYLAPYLESGDAGVRGLAAWCAGRLRAGALRDALERLLEDEAELFLVQPGGRSPFSVKDLAAQAIALLNTPF